MDQDKNILRLAIKKTINYAMMIWQHVVTAWQTRSFAFAFWGVFVFGTIVFGFLLSCIADIVHYLGLSHYATHMGMFSLWGYCQIAYSIFSIGYVYQKSSLLSLAQSRAVCLFLGFYVGFSYIMFKISPQISILFWASHVLHNLLIIGAKEYYRDEIIYSGNLYINKLKCAAGIFNSSTF